MSLSARRLTPSPLRLLAVIGAMAVVAAACSIGEPVGSTIPSANDGPRTTDGSADVELPGSEAGSTDAVGDGAFGSAWASMTERVSSEGEVPLDVAIEAFSFAVAPVLGSEAPDGDPPVFSGPIATTWLMGHWEELTSDQQESVESFFAELDPGIDASAGQSALPSWSPILAAAVPGFSRSSEVAQGTIGCRVDPELEVMVQALVVSIGLHVMPVPDIEYSSCVSADLPGPLSVPRTGSGEVRFGAPEACMVAFPEGMLGSSAYAGRRTELVAFFVFDCVIAGMAPDIRAFYNYPGWIRFGVDRFVASKLRQGLPLKVDGSWATWLSTPTQPLFGRLTDAMGFVSLVHDAADAEGFELLPAMLLPLFATGLAEPPSEISRTVYDAVMRRDSLTRWGGVYFDDPDTPTFKGFWYQALPDAVDTTWSEPNFRQGTDPSIISGAIVNGESLAFDADPYTAVGYTADFHADVVVGEVIQGSFGSRVVGKSEVDTLDMLELRTTSSAEFIFDHELELDERGVNEGPLFGQLLLPDETYTELPILGPGLWCTLASGCECPAGSLGEGRVTEQMLPGKARISITGHHEGAQLILHGLSLDEFCEERINNRPHRYLLTGGFWDWQAHGGVANNGCTWPDAAASGSFTSEVTGYVEIDPYANPPRWAFFVNFSERLEDTVTVPACFNENGVRKYQEFEADLLVSGLWSFGDVNSDRWVEGTACSATNMHTWGRNDSNHVAWEMRLVSPACSGGSNSSE